MAVTINGDGTIIGISAGGLPTGSVTADTLAANSVNSAELIDGAVDDSHLAGSITDSKIVSTVPGRKVVAFALLSATIDVSTTGTQDITGSLGGATPFAAWMFSTNSAAVGYFSGWGFNVTNSNGSITEENMYSRDHITASHYGPDNGKFYTSAVSAGAIQHADATYIANGVRLNKGFATGSPTGSVDIQIMVVY